MKTLIRIVGIYFAYVAVSSATTITFDDLSTGTFAGIPIPANYVGLQWSGFQVRNGETSSVILGNPYHKAVVSPDNVAGNIDGRSATFSSSSAFDLDSAYLTAIGSASLHLEVEGFVGTTLTYDNTYILNAIGPSLIDFNYVGVDEVEFIPISSPISPDDFVIASNPDNFAMDNLTINTPDAGATSSLLGIIFIGLSILRKKLAK
jgi:hypothetical protein